MGAPSTNPYAGKPLQQNVNTAYNTALGATTGLPGAGATAMGAGMDYAGQAGGLFDYLGNQPLANMNLQPYMDPYQQDVIDVTMDELNRQHGIQQQGIDDAAMARNAFGGDRMELQKGVLGGKFLDTKARALAELNSGNFRNAQTMGQFDIGAAGQGATGFGQLAQLLANSGIDLTKTGISALGDLSNLGFGFGQSIIKNQLASGALQDQQMQAIIDAAKGNVDTYTGYPMSTLQAFLGAIQNPAGYGISSTKGSTNPGILGTAAGIAGILGAL